MALIRGINLYCLEKKDPVLYGIKDILGICVSHVRCVQLLEQHKIYIVKIKKSCTVFSVCPIFSHCLMLITKSAATSASASACSNF